MDFVFDDHGNPRKFRHDVQLIESETKKVFSEKLRFIYLEMPKFDKTEAELETHYDKWLYMIKNLARLNRVPAKLQEKIFLRLFESAEIAEHNPAEQQKYQDSLKYYRDWKNALDTAIEEAQEENKAETQLEIALRMKAEGLAGELIARLTGLNEAEITKL